MFEESYLTLAQLNATIRQVLECEFADAYWVVAEVAEANVRRHCYIQLVEKQDNEIVAQGRATIWSSRIHLLDEFEEVTGETLKAGMEVLLRVRVRFHEVYGLSLDVISLNPVFTLGGMARKRRETLERLSAEGLIDRNRKLTFPAVPQRVAVITSPTAAGLGDFRTHLEGNVGGYSFNFTLFEAAVQGADAERQLAAAMREVSRQQQACGVFDVVVILRGGGSQVDLSCFDSYPLAAEIALCPIPVITGIGHEKDDSVADIVAHTRCKTPTAAAELLLGCAESFEARLMSLSRCVAAATADVLGQQRSHLTMATLRLSTAVTRHASDQRHRLESIGRRFAACVAERVAGERQRLAALSVKLCLQPPQALARRSVAVAMVEQRLRFGAKLGVERATERLERFDSDIRNLDPANVLRRGYSITRIGGRVLKDAQQARQGDVMETTLARGVVQSTVGEPEERDAR